MGAVKNKFANMSLRRAFSVSMIFTLAAVLAASLLTVFGGWTFRRRIFPGKAELLIWVDIAYADGSADISVKRIETGDEVFCINRGGVGIAVYSGGKMISEINSESENREIANITLLRTERVVPQLEQLSPKHRLAYMGAGALMIALPIAYAFVGVLLCALWFYRKKLAGPIEILKNATEKVSGRDLDFSVEYPSGDEMGELCRSFEAMRAALSVSSRAQWQMEHDRRSLQASVAHDLRNPIAVIRGYIEHMQNQLQRGTLTQDKLQKNLVNLENAAHRLEIYSAAVGRLSAIEDIEINPGKINLKAELLKIADDFKNIAAGANLNLEISCLDEIWVFADKPSLYRVLENLIQNAMRFAVSNVKLSCRKTAAGAEISVGDDGCGFPPEVLREGRGQMRFQGDHMGLGLAACNALCRRNGWELRLENTPSALVRIRLK